MKPAKNPARILAFDKKYDLCRAKNGRFYSEKSQMID